ncbi:ATP-dependent helicase (plasmid) [Chryseobacterium shandongense]|uniref:DNA 3'-5' helicase II n=2 Tax=Chryseobacterium shandongense TaxID=1493872 RepID=A0AAD1DNT7_9FLAO|nr:ATP-dependent helicase [Chryseobacterium shandongense]AZA98046.1 ATP-dependent helicase [Chryseobacterium shandongense]
MRLNTLPMFDITKIKLTDEEILQVEKKFGFSFNEGQLNFLKHWNSVDIQACPGSGKTTTLAAKLLLLSQKIPATFSQGICIITHTNIAAEEIKEKLGDSARIFFQYPNHFGTIQSFVDKYLTIPYYKKLYKASPKIVDEYAYNDVISNLHELVVSGAVDLLEKKNIFLGDLVYNRHNFDISKNINQLEKFSIKGLKPDTCEKYYQRMLSAKNKVLSYGYLTYEEAYSLAFKYIREFPLILDVLRERFSIVFVDEMQDMEDHQSALIATLFEKSTTIQKIGDTNQSIFSAKASEDENQWQPIINNDIQLKISNRLPTNIAALVKDICCKPQEMIGRPTLAPIRPIVFVYNDESILNVKDEFAKRVLKDGLASFGSIKIIGSRVGPSRLNISSYWPDYNRVYEKVQFKNLDSYLNFLSVNLPFEKNVKKLRLMFLNIICDCLKICKIKNPINESYFTALSFIKYINDIGHEDKILKMDMRFADWIIKLKQSISIKREFIAVIKGIIKFFNGTICEEVIQFYRDSEIAVNDAKPENKIYNYVQGNNSVDIYFDTIHGVKGETHSATLYLETYTRAYDIGGKILNFIIADERGKNKLRRDKACYRRLPHAYVALTRATHLLAIAVHQDRFLQQHQEYFKVEANGWELVFV